MSTSHAIEMPSTRDRLIFAGLWLLFFAGLGWLASRGGTMLVGAGGFLAAATLAALLLDQETPRSRTALGFLPAVCLVAVGLLAPLAGPDTCRMAGWLVGGLGGLACAISPPIGTATYAGWMTAFKPIGWTVSHLLLAVVFFGILTPTGLLMRLVGRDPLDRTLNRDARSYWVERRPVTDPRRYFRQS
ncbi:MAG: hypothetical protein JNL80_12255 [Phycisphaerae bacterium]|nr:hypothetical protein [Phycisphaerae bacterium]